MTAWNELHFRASALVELTRLDELAPAQRSALRDLESDPDFYGLFVAKPPLAMNLKAVPRQAAELFRALAQPSRLDDALLRDEERMREVVDMVLDGILEVECGGGFVSGAEAMPVLGLHGATAADAAAQLSIEALRHAEDLETTNARTLTRALYHYNTIPISPAWRARFATRDSVLAHIGADRAPLRDLLDRTWTLSTMEGWIYWSPRQRARRRKRSEAAYKLYVSPRPEHIRDAFEVVVRVLRDFRGTAFKIGDGAAGLLRPDKIVAYFRTRERLDEAAAELRRELGGCEAQGVPFTGGIDDRGLLSWGVDPPDTDRALQWLERESWRFWVARRLAAALALAKTTRGGSAVEPWRFAIERVRRQGVDVATWTPSAALWGGP